MAFFHSKVLFITVLLFSVSVLMKAGDPSKKIRVIHTTDMGWDDENTLIRMLLFANDQNILGITPSGGPWQDQLSNELGRIRAKIDLYEEVYDNLKIHDSDYPAPDYLRSITVPGNLDYDDYTVDTKGSMLIANTLLDESDDSPVWVTCWGGPVTVTAALRYINDNFPEKKTYVAKKMRIYMIAAKYQDTPEMTNVNYITDHYDPSPLMIDNLVYEYTNGWGELKYWCDNVEYSTEEWTNANYNQNHGALANSFQWKNTWNDDVDGDAPSVLHILGSAFGLRSTEDPTYGGWGSRFEAGVNDYKAHINLFADGGVDVWDGPDRLPESDKTAWLQRRCYSGARWADDFQNELAVRADWCVKSYKEANHPPTVTLNVDRDIIAVPCEVVKLSCSASDPDGDKLSYSWWQYKEAGTSGAGVIINQADKPEASFVCPDQPGTIHVILEVQDDDPEYPLTRYARVIVEVKGER